LCEKVCPNINITDLKKNEFETPKCYASINKNIEVRFDSTSGGVFTALADEVYKQGGYVGGAVYNEDWSVSQFLSTDKTDLVRLRSSKYLQSNFDGFYNEVKDALNTGKLVLVCGGPCQMAALHSFLRKPYDNLIIVDYICRGIPSPLLFKKFIEYLEQKHNSKVVYFKPKNKELGWRNLTTKVIYANKDVDYMPKDSNPWLQLKYEVPETCRHSCFECKFRGFPRIADISLGDLWAKQGSIPENLDNDLGTSIMFANNEKGKSFTERCMKRMNYSDFPFDIAVNGNSHLIKQISHSKHNRNEFYKDLNESFEKCIDKYLKNKTISFKFKLKQKVKNIYHFLKGLRSAAGWNFGNYCKNLYYNFFCKQVDSSIIEGRYFIIHKYCSIELHPKAKVILNAPFYFGTKKVKSSRLDSRLLVENNGKFIIKNAKYSISYGADIEVFKNATLEIEGGRGANIGLTIICGNHIYIGHGTGCGRNVTIRDNNGGHSISVRGYKNSIPVVIKDHVWLTESCTIMPGSIIDTGVIISARSVVSGHIPSFTIAKGDPAVVVDSNIYWKA